MPIAGARRFGVSEGGGNGTREKDPVARWSRRLGPNRRRKGHVGRRGLLLRLRIGVKGMPV